MAYDAQTRDRSYDGPRNTTDVCPPRKPTAAEYTEKRLSEVEATLSSEVSRIAGQYGRLREHFGLPPEPCSAAEALKSPSNGGMEYQINRIHSRVQEIMETVTKMNELI